MSYRRRGLLWPALIAWYLGIAGNACRAADVNEIIQRATAALKSDWAADPWYACVEKDEVRKGEKVTSKTFEVVMLDGSEYHLPLAVDDQPLPQASHRAELIRLKDELEHRRNESASARRSRIETWKKRRDESGELLLDFPGALTFQLLGEEVKNGHPSYAFSAAPKAGVIPATRAAKVLTGIEGKAWVEKEGMHPMRIECTVIKAVPVYGILASVLPGTDIDIGMTQVDPSTWLIDVVSMKLRVSKLHLIKSTSVTVSTYTQYRPNSAEVQELLSEAGHDQESFR